MKYISFFLEPSEQRLTQLPLSKIKSIMKCDPEVHIVSAEAIFLMTRAAELFVQTMAKEAHTHAVAGKKKTIARRDVDMTIESVDTLTFLEGMMNVWFIISKGLLVLIIVILQTECNYLKQSIDHIQFWITLWMHSG